MLRAIVSKRVIDRLIRARVVESVPCNDVEPLPVVWRGRVGFACNWEIPGWQGPTRRVDHCRRAVDGYLRYLESQFDIPDEA